MAKVQVHGVKWLAGEIVVPLGRSGHTAAIKTERLSDEVLAYVFNYGLKQVLNDAAAGGQTPDEKLGLFNKKVEGLYEGALRTARESDPVAREAKRIATDWLARKGMTPSAEGFKAKLAAAAASDAIRALAQANVERAKGLDGLEIDI